MTSVIKLTESWPELSSLDPPWIWITLRKPSEAPISVRASQVVDCCVRRVNGARIARAEDIFNELSATFQYPWYYGRNYPASVDCLRHLDWCEVGHRAFLGIVTDADHLLDVATGTIDNPLLFLLDLAVKIGGEMSEAYHWSADEIRPPTAFKWLFQANGTAGFVRLGEAVRSYASGPVKLSSYHGAGEERSFGTLP